MADIDPDRWAARIAALKNVNDSSVSFATLQSAQSVWSRANSDLEDFKQRGPVGKRDQRNPDLITAFERSIGELEARLARAAADVKRVEGLMRQSAAQRANHERLIDGVKKWAADNGVALPDQDGNSGVQMPGFAGPSRVHIPIASSTARSWP
jgi:hypothetical protein